MSDTWPAMRRIARGISKMADNPNNTGGKAFKVLWIDQLTRAGDTGGIERYNRVRFKTKGGLVRSIEIEEADLTEEKVNAILTKEAQRLDKVLGL